MAEFHVVEKDNPLALHCITWSRQRGEEWIEKYGDSGIFDNKGLSKESFMVIEAPVKKNKRK